MQSEMARDFVGQLALAPFAAEQSAKPREEMREGVS